MSTSGASSAPLCLSRKARLPPSAESSAQISPRPTASETLVTASPLPGHGGGAFRRLARGTDPDHVPGQVAALEDGDQPAARIELPAAESLASRGRKGVVVVVPGLAEGEWSQPSEVAGVIAGGKRAPAEVVAQRVDAEGRVMQQEDAHRSAPQKPRQTAAERTGQRHAEGEGDGEPDHHPEREGAAD